MFARFVELNIKPGKKTELVRKLKEEIVPILWKSTGLVDIIPLEGEIEPNKYHVLSLWHARFEAEKYEKEFFPKVKQLLEPFLTAPPTVKFYNVDETVRAKNTAVAA